MPSFSTSSDVKVIESEPACVQSNNVLPDLLPTTFHLAESSSLFSRISEGENVIASPIHNDYPLSMQQAFSVVEIRESNLSMPKKAASINRIKSNENDPLLTPANLGEVINTISVLESADYFEPECVETVNILDITSETSDTETSSTPIMDDHVARITTSQEDIDETVELLVDDSPVLRRRTPDTIRIEKARTSFDEEKRKLSQDRDLLHDSEVPKKNEGAESKSIRKKITPSLKEILSGMDDDTELSTNDTVFII